MTPTRGQLYVLCLSGQQRAFSPADLGNGPARCGTIAYTRRERCIAKNIPAWNFSWRFDYKRTAKRWLQGESNVKEKGVLVFQILLTERARTCRREREMAREGGAEKSLRREGEQIQGVIPVPQAIVFVTICELCMWASCLLTNSRPKLCATTPLSHSLPPSSSFSLCL